MANPAHFDADPMVLADPHRRQPSLLHLEPLRDGAAVALFSDNFYQRGGRYLARLERRGDALHWVGAFRQMEEADVLDRWTERTFSLHETPLIHAIHGAGDRVACVTRGGTATMLNHGPAFQTNLVATYGLTKPEPPAPPQGGGFLKSLFGRRSEPPPSPAPPGFELRDIQERPEGALLFSGDDAYEAVRLAKTNKVAFFRPGAAKPFGQLSLTPKQSLGELKPGKVGLAFHGTQMAVWSEDRLHLCRLEGMG
ncbi:hypothetical protein GCM10007301_21730 [Azorhizobium oxalatiphilum]|uniref:Uncharacterized protein n=1 Tax=Azorhizobium oxalatiphilum TaxID=980631 RepID=A0A917FAX3_9HYPH|nr:hypothetical protein [Azorhizobium oxalatiphilum]GGF61685.1 hypothetical protein GCM10007301_21730 [Azorhizobium oxalatiphilum]